MPEETTVVTDWMNSDYLIENGFDALAAERIALKRERDDIDVRIKELNLELGAMIATAALKSVRFEGFRLSLGYSASGGQLSREKLLEAGVTAEQLERGTTERKIGEPYLRVTEL